MTVKELKAALTEAGVEFDPKASKAELEALLPVEEAIVQSEPEVFDGREVLSKQEVLLNGRVAVEYTFLDGTKTLELI